MRKYNSRRLSAKYVFKALNSLEDSEGIQFFKPSASTTLVSIFYELLSRANYSNGRLSTRKERARKLSICFRDPVLLSEAYEYLLNHKKRSLQFCNEFFLFFQAHLENGRGYPMFCFQAGDLSNQLIPELTEEARNKYLTHVIGTPTSISERFFHSLNNINNREFFILSEHAFSIDIPDTNISNLWLHSAHVNLVPSHFSKILVPVPIVGTAAYDYQDGHMALANVNVGTGQIIYYDQPTEDISNFKDIFDSLIECFTFHFPREGGFFCELGRCPIQKPNECATVVLLVADCLINKTDIPEELGYEDFARARVRIFATAQRYSSITSFYN